MVISKILDFSAGSKFAIKLSQAISNDCESQHCNWVLFSVTPLLNLADSLSATRKFHTYDSFSKGSFVRSINIYLSGQFRIFVRLRNKPFCRKANLKYFNFKFLIFAEIHEFKKIMFCLPEFVGEAYLIRISIPRKFKRPSLLSSLKGCYLYLI